MRVTAVTMFVLLLAGLLSFWSEPALAQPGEVMKPSIEEARSLLATDHAAGTAMLAQLAQSGDPRSQLLYGSMLIEGRGVPQDMALGLAYMKVALASPDTAMRTIAQKAGATVAEYELRMPGRDIIKAEQLAAQMTREREARDVAAMQLALLPYTSEKLSQANPIVFVADVVQLRVPPTTASGQPVQLGCAAKNGVGCAAAPKPGRPGQCTGRLTRTDRHATSVGAGARTVAAELPTGLRRPGLDTTAFLLAHIDSSGWVCSAIVTRSADDPRLDEAALQAVRQWRFVPAETAGKPTESLHPFAIAFRVN